MTRIPLQWCTVPAAAYSSKCSVDALYLIGQFALLGNHSRSGNCTEVQYVSKSGALWQTMPSHSPGCPSPGNRGPVLSTCNSSTRTSYVQWARVAGQPYAGPTLCRVSRVSRAKCVKSLAAFAPIARNGCLGRQHPCLCVVLLQIRRACACGTARTSASSGPAR
jgi:hypothetical protein